MRLRAQICEQALERGAFAYWGERPGAGWIAARYGEAERVVLKGIWLDAEQPCGKRLHAALPTWLPFYEKHHGRLSPALRRNVLSVSPATIDRLLSPCRARVGSRDGFGTRPGTLLRSQIPVRTEHWDVSVPGYMEFGTRRLRSADHSFVNERRWLRLYPGAERTLDRR